MAEWLHAQVGPRTEWLGLSCLCFRCARALHGPEIQVKQRLLLVALVLVLLAQTKDFLKHFDVEALSLGFREDLLLPFIQRLDLFVDALNALDEGANAVAGDSCRICHAWPSSSGGRRGMGQSNREVNPGKSAGAISSGQYSTQSRR